MNRRSAICPGGHESREERRRDAQVVLSTVAQGDNKEQEAWGRMSEMEKTTVVVAA